MVRSSQNLEIIHKGVCISFAEPASFMPFVEKQITRNRGLSSTDRRECMELVYDAVRWRRRIWGDISPSQFHQTQFMDALMEAKELQKNPPLAFWNRCSMDKLAQELSYPTWMIQRWISHMGVASTISLALALNNSAPITLRANTLKTTRELLTTALQQEGVLFELGKHSSWAIHLLERKNIRSFSFYKKGWAELQDEASQIAVLATNAIPGQVVVDACTRTGGKALALAALMKNKGRIFATDIDDRSLDVLKKRIKKSGANIIAPSWVAPDDTSPLSFLKTKADVVVVDAPCSGLGTLRRHPWIKWSLSPSTADQYPMTQLKLLLRYAQWVKSSGILEYVTCTIHEKENEGVIKQFCSQQKNFVVTQSAMRLLRPDVEGCDGFFVTCLEKTNVS